MYRPPVRLYLNVFITSTNDVPEIYSIFRQMRLQFEFKLSRLQLAAIIRACEIA